MLSLEDVFYSLPENSKTIMDLYPRLEISKQQASIFNRVYGIENIKIATEMMFEFLARALSKICAWDSVYEIKYLIYGHTAQIIAPFANNLLRKFKKQFNLQNTIMFGLSMNKCVSTIESLLILNNLLKENQAAIVLSGEIAFTPALRLIPNTSIASDAAAAALILQGGCRNKLMAVTTKTYGAYSKGVWLNSDEIKNFECNYLLWLKDIIEITLDNAKVSIKNLKLILPHNINIPSWEKVSKTLQISLEGIYLRNVKRTSHCFGSDVLINYVDALNDQLFHPGDYFMMVTVGLGVTFSAALFQH